jgi:hypothetical protein
MFVGNRFQNYHLIQYFLHGPGQWLLCIDQFDPDKGIVPFTD